MVKRDASTYATWDFRHGSYSNTRLQCVISCPCHQHCDGLLAPMPPPPPKTAEMEIRRHKITAEHCPDDVHSKGRARTPLRTGGDQRPVVPTVQHETAFLKIMQTVGGGEYIWLTVMQ